MAGLSMLSMPRQLLWHLGRQSRGAESVLGRPGNTLLALDCAHVTAPRQRVLLPTCIAGSIRPFGQN